MFHLFARGGCLAAVASLLAAAPSMAAGPDHGIQGEGKRLHGSDMRQGQRAATASQLDAAGAAGLTVRFNRLGTPAVVTRSDGAVAQGLPAQPEAAARQFLRDNAALFGLSDQALANLELVSVAPLGEGAAVLLRQRFGNLHAGLDGMVAVAVRAGTVYFASSSLTRDETVDATGGVTAQEAVAAAARNLGRAVGRADVAAGAAPREFVVKGFSSPASTRLVAVPTPRDGVRAAHEVVLHDDDATAEPVGFQSFVDAGTGDVLARVDLVDYLEDNARFRVFPNVPPMTYATQDTRQLWCWTSGPGCQRTLESPASPLQWDIDPKKRRPSGMTLGNNARGTEKWRSNDTREIGRNYTRAPDREFDFAWTNQWFEERCNPAVFTSAQRNDIDAATSNLFAMHNRMHDWSYRLGFTETAWNLQEDNFGRGGLGGDPEHGNAQAGGVVGGPPTYPSRDNANQFTPPDGQLPITNMYLWQPIPAAFYSPCVDGDYDMSVIGHEYTHAISNRMVAGPDNRLVGLQANAMGESWSDLMAVEYLAEHGFAPAAGENPFAVGPYVTGDPVSGIRNYGMNASPLNYSDVAYDFVGPQVHADGEIWSATNYGLRQAFNAAYDGAFPSSNRALQASCAEGRTALEACPGNRRWVQLVFDAWLLMASGAVTMVDARDAMLAADQVRFGGAHQALMWNAFATRGLGEGAAALNADDHQPTPSFASPHASEGTVVLAPTDDSGAPVSAQLFVGAYEARVTPVADTDPETELGNSVGLVPGSYELLIRADGYGARRLSVSVSAGQVRELSVVMPRNLASKANGATATGDGVNLDKLIDDTEATNWAYRGPDHVRGRQVTVRLDPSEPAVQIRRIQVSAQLRPAITDDADPGGQSRYSALRAFELLACDATRGSDCADDADFRSVFTSPAAAFPAVAPRPRAPDLTLRSFEIPRTPATHVRLRVVDNQCTGGADFTGDQDDDPRHTTDCSLGSTQDTFVRAAELQVFEH